MPEQKLKTHVRWGAGLHGCLFADGPHAAESYNDAVNAAADTYELGRNRKAELKRSGSLELNLHRDGNEYVEINEFACEGAACPFCPDEEEGGRW